MRHRPPRGLAAIKARWRDCLSAVRAWLLKPEKKSIRITSHFISLSAASGEQHRHYYQLCLLIRLYFRDKRYPWLPVPFNSTHEIRPCAAGVSFDDYLASCMFSRMCKEDQSGLLRWISAWWLRQFYKTFRRQLVTCTANLVEPDFLHLPYHGQYTNAEWIKLN